MLDIRKIYEHQVICCMFKINNNESPPVVIDTILANQVTHCYNTRRKDDVRPPVYSLAGAQKAFSYQGPIIWNKLPNSIKDLNLSYTSFAKKVKLFLLSNDL